MGYLKILKFVRFYHHIHQQPYKVNIWMFLIIKVLQLKVQVLDEPVQILNYIN